MTAGPAEGFVLAAGFLPAGFFVDLVAAAVADDFAAGFFCSAPLSRPSRPPALGLADVALPDEAVLDFAAFFVVIGPPLTRRSGMRLSAKAGVIHPHAGPVNESVVCYVFNIIYIMRIYVSVR